MNIFVAKVLALVCSTWLICGCYAPWVPVTLQGADGELDVRWMTKDGKWREFLSNEDGVVECDGAISEEGEQVVWVRWRIKDGVFVGSQLLSRVGSHMPTRVLHSNPGLIYNPSFSEKGDALCFSLMRDGRCTLWTISNEGLDLRAVSMGRDLVFAPKGRNVVVYDPTPDWTEQGRQWHQLELTMGEARAAGIRDAQDLIWHRKGGLIYVRAGDRRLVGLTSGGEEYLLTEPPEMACDKMPVFVDSGSAIVFVRQWQDGRTALYRLQLKKNAQPREIALPEGVTGVWTRGGRACFEKAYGEKSSSEENAGEAAEVSPEVEPVS